MTFLELMNHVLRRLRENEVTTYNQTTYSAMVSDYVNDAIKLVEDAWDWTTLRSYLEVPTADGTDTYTLTGAGFNPKSITVYNTTKRYPLGKVSQAFIDHQTAVNSATSGDPKYFAYRGFDGSNDAQVQLYPTPTQVETLRFNIVRRTGELANDATELDIPAWPVIHMAVALLAREKGESGGTSVQEYFSIAERFLADAISHDYALTGGELDWDAGYDWESNVSFQ